MRAVVLVEHGVVGVADVAEPSLVEPDDALVRITRTAICGSDLHFVHGKTPTAPGTVLGHEGVGIVERVGAWRRSDADRGPRRALVRRRVRSVLVLRAW